MRRLGMVATVAAAQGVLQSLQVVKSTVGITNGELPRLGRVKVQGEPSAVSRREVWNGTIPIVVAKINFEVATARIETVLLILKHSLAVIDDAGRNAVLGRSLIARAHAVPVSSISSVTACWGRL